MTTYKAKLAKLDDLIRSNYLTQLRYTNDKLDFTRDTLNDASFPASYEDLEGIEDSRLFTECIELLSSKDPELKKNIEKKSYDKLNAVDLLYLKYTNRISRNFNLDNLKKDSSEILRNEIYENSKTYKFNKMESLTKHVESIYTSYDDVLKVIASRAFLKTDFVEKEVTSNSQPVGFLNKESINSFLKFIKDKFNLFELVDYPYNHFGSKETCTFGGMIYQSILYIYDSIIDYIKEYYSSKSQILKEYPEFESNSELEMSIKIKSQVGQQLNKEEQEYSKIKKFEEQLSRDRYDKSALKTALMKLYKTNDEVKKMIDEAYNTAVLIKPVVSSGYDSTIFKIHVKAFQVFHWSYLLNGVCPSPDLTKNKVKTIPWSMAKAFNIPNWFLRYDVIAQFFSPIDISNGKKASFLNYPINTYEFFTYNKMLNITPVTRLGNCLAMLISTARISREDLVTKFGISMRDSYLLTFYYNTINSKDTHYTFNYHRHCGYRDTNTYHIGAMLSVLLQRLFANGNDKNLFRVNYMKFCNQFAFGNYSSLTTLINEYNNKEEDFYINTEKGKKIFNKGEDVFDDANFVNFIYGLLLETLEDIKRIKILSSQQILEELQAALLLPQQELGTTRKAFDDLEIKDKGKYEKTKKTMEEAFKTIMMTPFDQREDVKKQYNTYCQNEEKSFKELHKNDGAIFQPKSLYSYFADLLYDILKKYFVNMEVDRVRQLLQDRQQGDEQLSDFEFANEQPTVNVSSRLNDPTPPEDVNQENKGGEEEHKREPPKPKLKLPESYKVINHKLKDLFDIPVVDPFNDTRTMTLDDEYYPLNAKGERYQNEGDTVYIGNVYDVNDDYEYIVDIINNQYLYGIDDAGERITMSVAGYVVVEGELVTKNIEGVDHYVTVNTKTYKEICNHPEKYSFNSKGEKINIDLHGFLLDDKGNRIKDEKHPSTYQRIFDPLYGSLMSDFKSNEEE